MALNKDLENIKNNLSTVKSNLDETLVVKGVATGSTLTQSIANVDTIPLADPGIFAPLGYKKAPDAVQVPFDYAKEIYDNWDANTTNLDNKFKDDKQLIYMPLVDTSKVISMNGTFQNSGLQMLPLIDTSQVTSMDNTFEGCKLQALPLIDTSKVTSMNSTFHKCTISDLPLIDTSKVTSMVYTFNYCGYLSTIPLLDTSNVTNMYNCFYSSAIKKLPQIDTRSVENFEASFSHMRELTETPVLDISSAETLRECFSNSRNLKLIRLKGNTKTLMIRLPNNSLYNTFSYLPNTGTFIYDYRYDYSKIIEELNKDGRNWICKTNIDAKEVVSMTITADDVVGNNTTTKVHYTAVINGTDLFTGEQLINAEITGDGISEPFEENPSFTDSRQITVSFTFFGQTVTTTITQDKKLRAYAELNGRWEKTDTVPNPDASLYDGVYQSVNKGLSNAIDTMTINFVDMPNFELYIRSDSSYYDYVYCGNLDETTPTEYKSTMGKQNAGTDINSYIKVEYPNDGGQHSVTVVYKRSMFEGVGNDRGYVFFTKPQQ